jgi:GntR family transcriptional regulator / MocR family aminotransferase
MYEQLAAILRARIAAGDFDRGPLPSVTTLMGTYDVGRDTVIRAIDVLRKEGLVFTVKRRGTYVVKRELPATASVPVRVRFQPHDLPL